MLYSRFICFHHIVCGLIYLYRVIFLNFLMSESWFCTLSRENRWLLIWPAEMESIVDGSCCQNCSAVKVIPWASYQIRKTAVVHALGMPGTFSPPPRVSDPDMQHGKYVTHVPWWMPGSLTRGFSFEVGGGENVPDVPGACATRNVTYLVRCPWLFPLVYVENISRDITRFALLAKFSADRYRWYPPWLFLQLARTGAVIIHLWPLLLTWFNFNPSMDK